MKSTEANVIIALGIVAMAALGGALAVFAEYDDSPGGQLLGLLLVIGAAVLSVRAAPRGS